MLDQAEGARKWGSGNRVGTSIAGLVIFARFALNLGDYY